MWGAEDLEEEKASTNACQELEVAVVGSVQELPRQDSALPCSPHPHDAGSVHEEMALAGTGREGGSGDGVAAQPTPI